MKTIDAKSWVQLTAGLFINALGWAAFLIPGQIVSGGVAGLGQIASYATAIPAGYFVLAVNAALLAIAVRVVGASFGVKTIYGIIVLSFFLVLLQPLFPRPVVEDRFLACLVGSILAGIGVGVSMNAGGSTGGTDIVAMIIGKFRNISPGRVYLAWDTAVISGSWLLFRSTEKLVYGFVAMAAISYVVDLLVSGANESHQFMIVSKESGIIARRVGTELDRGVTILHGKGWYSGEEKDVLFIVVRRDESSRVLRIIRETDRGAFLTMEKVMGVYGENFSVLRP
ncbi:MAG: hypothetical protein A2Z99_03945 [Treponema sp. GWB1_62_6]|nr:MAG: hypothetical protein A2Y36_17265 [Treponema sp. GWA1_62_8]OHE69501.1 MAG: hypothetical protein A2001_20020 [Treponema sp. GWC1_61_84]OHE72436.1 MAG: hypothetical protein A2Z99_03945 [Treponema sp. GWB1_62_6]OHE74933.1 MAG: hypothetical protein A2413_11895 [Treponema sp. RIFOXYC1_FULL_61_9]HCM24956.1 YitT family protein [Treponema sp.]